MSAEVDEHDPRYITIYPEACAIIGGKAKPISAATYYRGVKRGIYPPPEHPSPGVSRIRKQKLIDALNRGNGNGADRGK